MSLPSNFALDTETDGINGQIRTCLIQICPMGAGSIKDVVLFEGLDCYDKFFSKMEETLNDMDCHVCNLPYEFSRMKSYILDTYEFVDYGTKRLKAGQWTTSADNMTMYCLKICNQHGKTIRITDDLKRLGNTSVRKAGEGVRVTHPEWFEGMDEVKEHVEYNNGWSSPDHPEHDKFIHYSKVDAYTQAMIMRWVCQEGLDKNLTSASNGFYTALLGKYQKTDLRRADSQTKKYSRSDFKKYYPPLTREMQDKVEESLLGGFVYGETGTWTGTFVHLDYSSSYPYEYAFGRLGRGNVTKVMPDNPMYEGLKKNDRLIRWYVVSFDFKYRNGAGMPCISGKECRTETNRMVGMGNKKMKSGRVVKKLYTETYLEELRHSYELTDYEEHEMWVQKVAVGDFKSFIQDMYDGKSKAPKNSLERSLYKLNMNGGIHGKTITKTHRRERVFYGGVEQLIDVVNEPDLQSTIGFTAMMNARERLLRDCRLVQEAGYKVFMCDTDSMVVNTTEENLRKVLGDKISKKTKTMEDLGKFEFEEDDEGRTEFEVFKCWGLKRYCEINDEGRRKSAFAGMREEHQENLLNYATDGTAYSWMQLGAVTDEFGKNIMDVKKTMKAENIWYESKDDKELPMAGDGLTGGLKRWKNGS